MVIWSFVIFDFGNVVIAHYKYRYISIFIVAVLTQSVFDFDK
jgi:hypothetical protein